MMGNGDYHYCKDCGNRMLVWQKDCDTCKRITKLEAENAKLKAALNEAMEWNWLDKDAPPRFDLNNLPTLEQNNE